MSSKVADESKSSKTKSDQTQSVFTQQVQSDAKAVVHQAKVYLSSFVAEKLWRMEVMGQINAYVRGENRQLKESLNIKHNLEDLNLYGLTKL